MSQARLSPDHDDIFDNLKNAVVNEAMRRHSWEEKVNIILQLISIFSILSLIKSYNVNELEIFKRIFFRHPKCYALSNLTFWKTEV